MNTIFSNGFTAKDIFNTKTASETIKNYVGKPIKVFGYALVQDADKTTGEVIQLGYIKTDDNKVIGFKSGVCCDALETFNDFISDADIDITKGEILIIFTTQTAKSGREFYSFRIAD